MLGTAKAPGHLHCLQHAHPTILGAFPRLRPTFRCLPAAFSAPLSAALFHIPEHAAHIRSLRNFDEARSNLMQPFLRSSEVCANSARYLASEIFLAQCGQCAGHLFLFLIPLHPRAPLVMRCEVHVYLGQMDTSTSCCILRSIISGTSPLFFFFFWKALYSQCYVQV